MNIHEIVHIYMRTQTYIYDTGQSMDGAESLQGDDGALSIAGNLYTFALERRGVSSAASAAFFLRALSSSSKILCESLLTLL